MAETWVDLDTFGVGELLGSVDANNIIGNLKFLRTPARYFYQRSYGDADYTTTSATMGNIDGTNMSIELETFGNPVRIEFHCRVTHSTTGTVNFDFVVDGVIVSNDTTNGLWSGRADIAQAVDLTRLVDLAAGVHTFAIQWRTSVATATIQVESAVQFEVHEEY